MSICRLLLFLIVAASPVAAVAAADPRAIEAEVARLETVRIDALLKGDLKALEQLYAEDLVYIHAAGRVDGKKQYLASLAAGNLTYVSLKYDPPAKITVAGRDTAIVTGRANIEAKNKAGQVTKRVLTTTTVYVRFGPRWQVVSYQGTPVQP